MLGLCCSPRAPSPALGSEDVDSNIADDQACFLDLLISFTVQVVAGLAYSGLVGLVLLFSPPLSHSRALSFSLSLPLSSSVFPFLSCSFFSSSLPHFLAPSSSLPPSSFFFNLVHFLSSCAMDLFGRLSSIGYVVNFWSRASTSYPIASSCEIHAGIVSSLT